ncbi:MAG TPA: hypothetical protein VF752_09155 [Thermoleophilaceae bacterium]
MLRCRVFGHRFRFTSSGNEMRWTCQRGCGASASKRYATAADARRYAAAFDREDRADLGRRAPLFGLLPLRIARAIRDRGKVSGRSS